MNSIRWHTERWPFRVRWRIFHIFFVQWIFWINHSCSALILSNALRNLISLEPGHTSSESLTRISITQMARMLIFMAMISLTPDTLTKASNHDTCQFKLWIANSSALSPQTNSSALSPQTRPGPSPACTGFRVRLVRSPGKLLDWGDSESVAVAGTAAALAGNLKFNLKMAIILSLSVSQVSNLKLHNLKTVRFPTWNPQPETPT